MVKLYHDVTHTLIQLEQIRGRYYVTERGLDCLLLRGIEGIDVEKELHDEEILPLIDVIDTRHNIVKNSGCWQQRYILLPGAKETIPICTQEKCHPKEARLAIAQESEESTGEDRLIAVESETTRVTSTECECRTEEGSQKHRAKTTICDRERYEKQRE